MKKLFLFILLLAQVVVTEINAQCANCVNDGSIEYPGDNVFIATVDAQAYYWEICEGTATIGGSNTQASVLINCNGDGNSKLRLTRFVDGECIESCIEFACVRGDCELIIDEEECNCFGMNETCLHIMEEGSNKVCETLFASIEEHCLPDCWERIDWEIRHNGVPPQVFMDETPHITYAIPPETPNNIIIVVTATITLSTGEVCTLMGAVEVECGPDPGGQGGGQRHQPVLDGNAKSNKDVIIYPNPVEMGKTLSLPAQQLIDVQSVEILNFKGQLMQSLIPNGKDISINANWTAGIYFLRLQKEDGVMTRKFIIQ